MTRCRSRRITPTIRRRRRGGRAVGEGRWIEFEKDSIDPAVVASSGSHASGEAVVPHSLEGLLAARTHEEIQQKFVSFWGDACQRSAARAFLATVADERANAWGGQDGDQGTLDRPSTIRLRTQGARAS